MKIICQDCQHNKVCRFKKDYEETLNSLEIKIPTPFELDLKCPHYTLNLLNYHPCTLQDYGISTTASGSTEAHIKANVSVKNLE